MAIVSTTENGWYVDHGLAINKSVEDLELVCHPGIFGKNNRFLRDVEVKKDEVSKNEVEDGGCLEEKEKRKRKRKRKYPLNVGEIKMAEYHKKHSLFIQTATDDLISSISKHKSSDSVDHSFMVVPFLEKELAFDFASLCLFEDKKKVVFKTDLILTQDDEEYEDILNRRVLNPNTSKPLEINYQGESFIIPPDCSFYISDFKLWIKEAQHIENKFDLVVIDPPWENKSVKRKKSYNYLPEYDMKKIPLQNLLAENGIVVVWVTNKQKYIEFVCEHLFPHWELELIGHWHWAKVKPNGEFLTELDHTQRKPYEPILIGRRPNAISSQRSTFPMRKIICSVPLDQHSRKPPLNEIFSTYIPNDASCLEMFSRSLLPGWTSWGNECLKFQHEQFFVKN